MRSGWYGMATVLALGAAGAAGAQDNAGRGRVVFIEGAGPAAEPRMAKLAVYDAAGTARFVADEDFVRQAARNSTLRVLEWNIAARLVRVSRGEPAIWLDCGQLEPMEIACSTLSIAPAAGGGVLVSRLGPASERGNGRPDVGRPVLGAVPYCPGDPRCPR